MHTYTHKMTRLLSCQQQAALTHTVTLSLPPSIPPSEQTFIGLRHRLPRIGQQDICPLQALWFYCYHQR